MQYVFIRFEPIESLIAKLSSIKIFRLIFRIISYWVNTVLAVSFVPVMEWRVGEVCSVALAWVWMLMVLPILLRPIFFVLFRKVHILRNPDPYRLQACEPSVGELVWSCVAVRRQCLREWVHIKARLRKSRQQTQPPPPSSLTYHDPPTQTYSVHNNTSTILMGQPPDLSRRIFSIRRPTISANDMVELKRRHEDVRCRSLARRARARKVQGLWQTRP